MTVALLGGGLKVKQKITGRMADALSELYLLSCVLKRYEDDGRQTARPRRSSNYCARNCLYRFQQALRGVIAQFPGATGALADARRSCSRFGTRRPASDARRQGASCALVLEPGDVRDRLTRDIFVSDDPQRSRPGCSK